MIKVKLVAITKPLIEGIETANEFIAYAARVSNPSNQMNTLTAPKLIQYLIKNKHWSPFEQVSLTLEIEAPRDIIRQILRHRSNVFQEFSGRYADPTNELGFIIRETRLQDPRNRQNSISLEDSNLTEEQKKDLQFTWSFIQQEMINLAKQNYKWAIENGIAKECARVILPEGLTFSRLYMTGNLRSFIHWVDVRDYGHGAQKEHSQIANAAKEIIIKEFPSLEDYFYPNTTAQNYIHNKE